VLEAAIGEALDRGIPHPNAVPATRSPPRTTPRAAALVAGLPAHVKTRDTPVQRSNRTGSKPTTSSSTKQLSSLDALHAAASLPRSGWKKDPNCWSGAGPW